MKEASVKRPIGRVEVLKRLLWAVTAAVVIASVWLLETERATVETRVLKTSDGQVTIYEGNGPGERPLVVVTHGFAGSIQMMQYISRDLARAGFTVAAFDFHGHGRNDARLSKDVTQIEGTTRQLVNQTSAVLSALQDGREGGAVALIGHSMATDIIIRAAEPRDDVSAIVAISMYSEAITPEFPKRLLVISGEWEERLRRVGLEVVAQLGGAGVEGQTVRQGEVVRRAIYVPRTEHVAVLFARDTLNETRAWVQKAYGSAPSGAALPRGPAILVVLLGLVILSAPVFRLLPERSQEQGSLPLRTFFIALALPVLPACLAAASLGGSILGLASFGNLVWFFGLWGVVSLSVILRSGQKLQWPDWRGVCLLLIWALGFFAFALDRYGAAFVPIGSRVTLMLVLILACVPFALADRLLVRGAVLWQRVLARIVPIAALTLCMFAVPERLGLLFTVLPVMVLFYCVYGTMARFVALRQGPETAALALGIILAWSIAASTPLFIG